MKRYKTILLVSIILAVIIHNADISLPQYLVTEAGLADRLIILLQHLLLNIAGVFLSLVLIHLGQSLFSRLTNRQQKRLLNK